jgi:Ala-tRNA(Pro) deacylase
MRVSQYLSDQHVSFEEMVHPPAFTSQKLARFLHVPGRQVMKSVLLRGSRGFFVAVLPASQQVDLRRLSGAFGGSVRLATDAEVRDHFPDCERGGLMPFGRLYGLPTFLDASIPLDTIIVFEAQRHAVAIRMSCRDFVKLEGPERLAFAAPEPS